MSSLISFRCLGFSHIHVHTYVEMGPEGAYNCNGKGFSELYPKVQDLGGQYSSLVKNGFSQLQLSVMIKWPCLKSSTGSNSLSQLLDRNRSILKGPFPEILCQDPWPIMSHAFLYIPTNK